MKKKLNDYLNSTQKVIGLVLLGSSIFITITIFAIQYRDKEYEINQQLSFLGSVTRENLLSGNGLEVYQICKRFFESKEILSLKITSTTNQFCSMSRPTNSFFRISSTQNVLFNPALKDSDVVAKIELISSSNALLTSSVTILLFVFIAISLLLLSKRRTFKILKKDIVEPIEHLANSLLQIKLNEPVRMLKETRIKEVEILNLALIEFSKNIQRAAKEDIKKAEYEALWRISRQVAHDIRSPLAALQMSLGFIENLPDTNKSIIESATSRIYNIANTLLTEKNFLSTSYQTIYLPDFLEKFLEEKRMEHIQKNVHFKIDNELNNRAFIKADPTDFGRALSNIINNSVEALESSAHGLINITLTDSHDCIKLKITDNGCGIPDHVLTKLGKEEVSYGKSQSGISGTGIGFSYAKEVFSNLGGKTQVDSALGHGTSVSISLPLFSPKVVKEVSEKDLSNHQMNYDCVLLEDDSYIRLAWKERAKKAGISLLAVKDIIAFKSNLSLINKESTKVYLDSDFKDEIRGEELAAELHFSGYKNVFLSSGYDQLETDFSWLKNVGKNCPF